MEAIWLGNTTTNNNTTINRNTTHDIRDRKTYNIVKFIDDRL